MKLIDKLLAKAATPNYGCIVGVYANEEEANAAHEAYQQAHPYTKGKFIMLIDDLEDDEIDENGVGYGFQLHGYYAAHNLDGTLRSG